MTNPAPALTCALMEDVWRAVKVICTLALTQVGRVALGVLGVLNAGLATVVYAVGAIRYPDRLGISVETKDLKAGAVAEPDAGPANI